MSRIGLLANRPTDNWSPIHPIAAAGASCQLLESPNLTDTDATTTTAQNHEAALHPEASAYFNLTNSTISR